MHKAFCFILIFLETFLKVVKNLDLSTLYHGCSSMGTPASFLKVVKNLDLSTLYHGCSSMGTPASERQVITHTLTKSNINVAVAMWQFL